MLITKLHWPAAEIIGGLLQTESQSRRVADNKLTQIRVGEIFLSLISNNSLLTSLVLFKIGKVDKFANYVMSILALSFRRSDLAPA